MNASSDNLMSLILNFFSTNLSLFFFNPLIRDCLVIPFKIELDNGVVYRVLFFNIHAVLELPPLYIHYHQ